MLIFAILPLSAAVQFAPYEARDPYKCGTFVAEQVNDRFMSYYYALINGFNRLLSRKFKHERMFSTEALQGNLMEIQNDFREKYPEFIEHEQWWLILSVSLVLFSALFTFLYIIYSCWVCCCCKNGKKDTMDGKHDGCKRYFLNFIIGVFVIVNVFSVAALLVSSQYAQYGADELPQRFSQCVDDLLLYKRETEARFKKLLLDDYRSLNDSINTRLSVAGADIVQNVKKATGAQVIDVLSDVTNAAREIITMSDVAERETKHLNDALNKFRNDFAKMHKEANHTLNQCITSVSENEYSKSLCRKALGLLNEMNKFPEVINEKIISEDAYAALKSITKDNVSVMFLDVSESFSNIEKELQIHISEKKSKFVANLKQLGNDIFKIAETINIQIRSFNFDTLNNHLASYNDKNSAFRLYVRYCWYGTLLLSGIFALIALYFLFAWCYGCFGRRPTYYEDDCCVRTTGSKLFTCGIWLSIFLLVFLSALTSVITLIGGNISNLICDPLAEPLSRKDILSFGERLLALNRFGQSSGNVSSYLGNITLSAFIQACARNQTLYTIFDFDSKFHLNNFRHTEKETFDRLEAQLNYTFGSFNIDKPVVNISSLEKSRKIKELESNIATIFNSKDLNTEILQDQAKFFNFTERRKPFIDAFARIESKPKAISETLEQLKVFETANAGRILDAFQLLIANATIIKQQFSNLSVPLGDVEGKLQHAEALLRGGCKERIKSAALELVGAIRGEIKQYVDHVQSSLSTKITSCVPLAEIARGSRAAFCTYTVDPFIWKHLPVDVVMAKSFLAFKKHLDSVKIKELLKSFTNGIWASMLISIMCIIATIVLASCAMPLYRKMHAYPKYVVHEPIEGNQMNAFATDTYDIRNKQQFYSAGSSSEEYSSPYIRTRR